MRESIDKLIPERGLIQLSAETSIDFNIDDFQLSRLNGDVLLCEYIDITEDGDSIYRNGLHVPIHSQTKAWRKARVVLTGQDTQWSSVGDVVIFPNNFGVEVHKMDVKGHGSLKNGVFLNESRIFGACEAKASSKVKSKVKA